MAATLPYLASYKNVPVLFEKIAAAKVPDKFTHSFLTTTIGLKGTNDRALIPFLRHMGFLDQSANPTSDYRLLKGSEKAKAIAAGVRKAYGPLFDADQNAHQLTGERLKGLIAQVAGTDADTTGKIAGSFNSVVKLGDFDSSIDAKSKPEPVESPLPPPSGPDPGAKDVRGGGLRTDFHYNLQIHLPSNGSEETYINIFNAIRKTFQ